MSCVLTRFPFSYHGFICLLSHRTPGRIERQEEYSRRLHGGGPVCLGNVEEQGTIFHSPPPPPPPSLPPLQDKGYTEVGFEIGEWNHEPNYSLVSWGRGLNDGFNSAPP